MGPRYTQLGGGKHWHYKRDLWKHTKVGYILHRPRADGTFVPFEWSVHRDIPRPPRR